MTLLSHKPAKKGNQGMPLMSLKKATTTTAQPWGSMFQKFSDL
jgi:hypothetical protein